MSPMILALRNVVFTLIVISVLGVAVCAIRFVMRVLAANGVKGL